MMARSREVDTAARPGEHPDVSAVPAALAAGELFGGMSGKDVITAIVLAIDFNIRLRLATGRIVGDTPWTAGTYAAFISAIVAGKLMKLDESRFLDTLGLAFSHDLLRRFKDRPLDTATAHRAYHVSRRGYRHFRPQRSRR